MTPARPFPAQALGDGLVLRRAEAADVEAVAELNVAVFGTQEGHTVRSLMAGPLAVEWLVVAAGEGAERPGGGTIASACARIPHAYLLDRVAVPGSQIENVATDERFRGRGLVRTLFAAHHRRAAEDGELLQVIGGIPYYYRKLGYGYGFDVPASYSIGPGTAAAGDRVRVRPAGRHDMGWLLSTEARRSRDGLTVRRSPSTFSTWMARAASVEDPPWEHLAVAEVGDAPVGWLRTVAWAEEGQLFVLPPFAPDREVADALLAHAVGIATHLADHLGRPVEVLATDQPGTPWSRTVHAAGRLRPEPSGYYARTADEVGLLRALEPVLSRRLAGSGLAHDTGEVVISLYERAVRLAWAGGRITAVEPATPDQDPFDQGGVGVAPDWFPALVLGRWGATGLAERTDDTLLGDHAPVLDVLFPPRPNDLITDL